MSRCRLYSDVHMYAEHCCCYLIHTALICTAIYEYTFNPSDGGLLHDPFKPDK